ncbi:MAG: HDIG domain-containing metalloprotein [Ardenticatenaceae bacterium]
MHPYRVEQVWRWLHTHPSGEDIAWVRERLPAPQQAIFFAQQVGDQAHAVTVARALEAAGWADERLVQAALLHDVGKAPGVSLPFRTALVLLNRFRPSLLDKLSPDMHGWLAPLARAHHHAALGAELARRAGSHPYVVSLIANHQRPASELSAELREMLQALKAVDNAS